MENNIRPQAMLNVFEKDSSKLELIMLIFLDRQIDR